MRTPSARPTSLLAALLVAGCGCDSTRPPLPHLFDSVADLDVDPVWDPVVDTSDPPIDTTLLDTSTDTISDGEEVLCPPEGEVGKACTADADCPPGNTCLTEVAQEYEGLTYVSWRGGYCLDATWDLGCDPLDADGCPAGSRCAHLGTILCEDRWACLDACAYADPAGDLWPFNACCRPGYLCDPLFSVCVPGCSSDRECCEAWDDDGDTLRETGEVSLVDGCELACSPDTHGCTGPGGGAWTSPCTQDAQCPEGGTCVPEGCSTVLAGSFDGGLCVGFGCDAEPAVCSSTGGGCVANPGGVPWGAACLAVCHAGVAPSEPGSDCRDGWACRPACEGGFVGSAPPGGEDGYCTPARGLLAPEGNAYGSCTSHDECPSGLGLGICLEVASVSHCSVTCNDTLATDMDVCKGPSTAGGPPEGACFGCACRPTCTTPGAALADTPCDSGGRLSCYALGSLSGPITWSAGAAEPAGLCLPACLGPSSCEQLWGIAHECDPVTGLCLF